MLVLTKEELYVEREFFKAKIIQGAIFIHPMDTIYGLGCNAKDDDCVKRLRELKNRPLNKPFSIVAPSKDWIYENCEVNDYIKRWIEAKLPGPYTFILKLRNKEAISRLVNNNSDYIGIRIPNHWMFDFINKHLKIPIITTSVNRRGESFMSSLENLDENIRISVDFIIYEGEKNGRPSTIINLVSAPLGEISDDRDIIEITNPDEEVKKLLEN